MLRPRANLNLLWNCLDGLPMASVTCWAALDAALDKLTASPDLIPKPNAAYSYDHPQGQGT